MGHTLIFTAPTEAFWVQMKVALIAGLFLASPGILWQVWRFVEPGLHPHEKKYAVPFILIGSLLFIGGGAFSLFVVTPYALNFLLSYARPGLTPMITLENHVDFLLKFTVAFGAGVRAAPRHHASSPAWAWSTRRCWPGTASTPSWAPSSPPPS